ncbi:scavenger receptor class B member 1-like [Lycorma delicatula]|uniref:scavenger receptor class B member 1-like n=1 Tax=Lycorma delicatula TaxID=130591 RepID=UPI003F50D4AF
MKDKRVVLESNKPSNTSGDTEPILARQESTDSNDGGDDKTTPKTKTSSSATKTPTKRNSIGARKVSRIICDEESGKLVPLTPALDVSSYKGYLRLSLCGFALMALSYAIHAINPLEVVKNKLMKMEEGSFAFSIWKKPPVKVYVGVFLFNITNSERFLSGQDKKIKVTEIGPYVYSEMLENTNIMFNSNNTLSFMPYRTLAFEPELSVGDPTVDLVNVINIPLVGISSMLHSSSLAFNLILRMLVQQLDLHPVKTLSVDEFLWGYDDPLINLGSKFLPSWIHFSRFGLLDRILDEGNNTVTMNIPKDKDSNKIPFSIDHYNGLPGIKQWGYNPEENRTKCNDLKNTLEGVLFPRHLEKNQTLHLYRKAFCRTLPIVYKREVVNERGIPMYVYEMADDAFDSPDKNQDNACYCNHDQGTCLPSGLSDISPCYFRIPVALSRPHFFKSDPKLLDDFDGLYPDEEKHTTSFGVQPDMGVPMFVKTSIQINLVVRKTKMQQYSVRKFDNKIIPIFWLQVNMTQLPDSVNFLLDLCFIIAPPIQTAFIMFFFLIGFTLLVIATLGYIRTGRFITNTSISNNTQDRTIAMLKPAWGRTRYTPIQIIPMSNTHIAERTR